MKTQTQTDSAPVHETEANGYIVRQQQHGAGSNRLRIGVTLVALRTMCFAASTIALCFMVTARQTSTVSLFGFPLQLYSKWTFSNSYEYLVAVSCAVAVYSLLQLSITTWRVLMKSQVFSSRNQAWLTFALDQILAYALISAASAAIGVTNLNRVGVKLARPLPDFCKDLHSFCTHAMVSMIFAFFAFVCLATSALRIVIWLSRS